MPNQIPLSRYLLLGIAALMLGAALPDSEALLQRARQLSQFRTVRMTRPMVEIHKERVRAIVRHLNLI